MNRYRHTYMYLCICGYTRTYIHTARDTCRQIFKKLFNIQGCFPGGSEGKAFACIAGRPGFNPWVGKIPWRRKWQPTPVFLPGKSHGRRSLIRYTVHGVAKSQT